MSTNNKIQLNRIEDKSLDKASNLPLYRGKMDTWNYRLTESIKYTSLEVEK
jgi:hypothetical protein